MNYVANKFEQSAKASLMEGDLIVTEVDEANFPNSRLKKRRPIAFQV